jgi:molybdate transport system permease protein
VNWFPLWNSLRIAAISTVITFFLGIFLAQRISGAPRWLKGALDTVLTLPLVLPPTVIGFFIGVRPQRPVGACQACLTDGTMRWQAR